jgi:hypothetical protein
MPPIAAGDIDYHLSGGAANNDPDAALGGAISSVELVDASLHNLFDIVGSDEAAAGDSEHRCIYVKNAHPTLTLQNAKVWIQTQTPSGDTDIQIALAGEGVNGTAETVADESTAPSGETFSAPANEGEALAIGDIPPGQHQAIWIKRNIGVGAGAYNNDSAVLRVKGDTAA